MAEHVQNSLDLWTDMTECSARRHRSQRQLVLWLSFLPYSAHPLPQPGPAHWRALPPGVRAHQQLHSLTGWAMVWVAPLSTRHQAAGVVT